MTVTAANKVGKGWMSIPITGGTATAGGGLASVLNPEGVDVLIVRSVAYFTTNPAAGANLNIGIGTSATHDASDMASSWAVNDVDGEFHNVSSVNALSVTEVGTPAVWGSAYYINVTGDSTTASLAGTLYIEYLRI